MNKTALIVIIVLVVLGAAAGYFFILAPANAGPAPEVRSAYTPGEYFITNVSDTTNLVKTTIVLELDVDLENDGELLAFMETHNYIIRDTIVMTLRSKTYEELMRQDVKEILAAELVPLINQKLAIEHVKGIYFNDYVVQ